MGKTIALLGKGEVGSAIKKLAEEGGYKVIVRELDYDEFDGQKVEALHVCIPQKDDSFIDIVAKAVSSVDPEIVIIHTSTAPGITEKIARKIKLPTAHSPIRGDHPDLYDAVKSRFVKYVGGVDENSTKLAIKHLKDIGIRKVKDGKSAISTEIGKMLNILSFTWSIIFCKWAKEMVDEFGADFDVAYKDFMETYNQGYEKTRPNVVQPVLKPEKGPIGGHCIIPDTVLVEDAYPSDLTKFILKKNNEYKKEK